MTTTKTLKEELKEQPLENKAEILEFLDKKFAECAELRAQELANVTKNATSAATEVTLREAKKQVARFCEQRFLGTEEEIEAICRQMFWIQVGLIILAGGALLAGVALIKVISHVG